MKKRLLISLGLSAFSWECSKQMGIFTFEDLAAVKPDTLTKLDGFSYIWLEEITGLLEKYGLIAFIQPAS